MLVPRSAGRWMPALECLFITAREAPDAALRAKSLIVTQQSEAASPDTTLRAAVSARVELHGADRKRCVGGVIIVSPLAVVRRRARAKGIAGATRDPAPSAIREAVHARSRTWGTAA